MSDARIRPFQTGEESLLADLFNRCFAGQPNFWPQTAQTIAGGVTRRTFFEATFDPNLLLIAQVQEKAVGFAHGCITKPQNGTAGAKPVGIFLLAGVDTRVRRQGVGSALMAGLASALLKAGTGGVSLDPHGFLPFYSNAEGPQTVPFGMV